MGKKVDAYILSNKNPDTDGVCSSIAFHLYQKKLGKNFVPIIKGQLTKETIFVLNHAKYLGGLKKKIDRMTPVFLIDSHNPLQIPHLFNFNRVVGIYDHHIDGDLSIYQNLDSKSTFINPRLGAVATLIAQEILNANLMDTQIAILLGSAILSNTFNFTAPSTNQLDFSILTRLKEYAVFDEPFISKLFSTRDNIKGIKTNDLLKSDLKIYSKEKTFFDKSQIEQHSLKKPYFGITQLEVINFNAIIERNDLKKAMIEVQLQNNLFFYFVNVIDIISRKSLLIYYDVDTEAFKSNNGLILKSLFPFEFKTKGNSNFLFFQDILLRKTNIVPKLYNLFNPNLIERNKQDSFGLVFGRFQILHLGHIEYFFEALQRCKKLIIGITQLEIHSKFPFDPNFQINSANPLNYLERYLMIKDTLINLGIDPQRFEIVPFYDTALHNNTEFFPSNVVIYFALYEGWESEQMELLSTRYKTSILWKKNLFEKAITSSEIRKLIITNQKWDNLVPKTVYEFLNKHKIADRIKGG
jgi:cytidyltransferase-like protein